MEQDIDIYPIIENGILNFNFVDTSVDTESIKRGTHYRFAEMLMKAFTKEHTEHTGKVNFIGNINTMKYAMAVMFKLYEDFWERDLMSDLEPYDFEA